MEILFEPVKLDRYELEAAKSHRATGHEILEDTEFPWPVAEMPRERHEWIDGCGWPAGLKCRAFARRPIRRHFSPEP